MDSDGQHEPTQWAKTCSCWIERDWTFGREPLPRSPKSEASVIDAPMVPPRQPSGPLEPAQVLPAPERLHEQLHGAAPRALPAAGASIGRQRLQILLRTPAISRGRLQGRNSAAFSAKLHGSSKLDLAVLWDFVASQFFATLRLHPRRAISRACGRLSVVVQLLSAALR